MKYLILLAVLLAGCGKISAPSYPLKDTIAAEGFVATSVVYHRTFGGKPTPKDMEFGVVTTESPSAPTEKPKSIYPSKYLRLLTAEAGCGPCIHQHQILIGSDWIIHLGTEEQNKDKRPYHGLEERVKSLNDSNNPLWAKYGAPAVPFWQLVVDGKVVETHSGVLSLKELRAFYEKR